MQTWKKCSMFLGSWICLIKCSSKVCKNNGKIWTCIMRALSLSNVPQKCVKTTGKFVRALCVHYPQRIIFQFRNIKVCNSIMFVGTSVRKQNNFQILLTGYELKTLHNLKWQITEYNSSWFHDTNLLKLVTQCHLLRLITEQCGLVSVWFLVQPYLSFFTVSSLRQRWACPRRWFRCNCYGWTWWLTAHRPPPWVLTHPMLTSWKNHQEGRGNRLSTGGCFLDILLLEVWLWMLFHSWPEIAGMATQFSLS